MAWASGFVETSGVRIHYLRTGGDKRPLLLLHGYTDDGRCWSRVARRFEAVYDVILPDARGHGESSAPEDAYSDSDQAGDALAFVGALGLTGLHVIGHSMGGVVAALAASREPQRFDRLVLEDPPPSPGRVPRNPMGEAVQRAALKKLRASSRDALIERCRRSDPGWSAEEIELWADSKLKVSVDVARRFATPLPRWHSALDGLDRPLLIVAGEPEHGSLIHDEDLADLAGRLRNGAALRIAGAGHSVHRDRFDDYIRVVERFLFADASPSAELPARKS